MDEGSGRGEGRQSSLKPNSSYKPTLSGRSTPRNSPSFRRLNSSRTPHRDSRGSGSSGSQWFRSNRIVYWLLLITLWAYLGFYVQSKWAHGDNKQEIFAFGSTQSNEVSDSVQNQRRDLIADENVLEIKNKTNKNNVDAGKNIDVILAKKKNSAPARKSLSVKKKSKKAKRNKPRGQQKTIVRVENDEMEEQEQDIPKQNSTYGMLVGPFGLVEDQILEWSPEKRSGTCERKGEFARLVWSRKFVLIFHELSLTGAPLSMLELGTELMSCGATVTAIVLSRKGGLMPELSRRKIKVLEDKAELSYKAAKKADLIIAGSAVCASWIDQYMERWTTGSSQVAWWIMENRMEYFNRTKPVLDSVRMLIFISESQSTQWQSWCEEEKIKLISQPTVVPLSVNEELAFVAGIGSTLNTPYFSTEKMMEKRSLLRDAVRKEMGLTDNDMLVISLSSINPGKGQFLLLESTRLAIEQNLPHNQSDIRKTIELDEQNLPHNHSEIRKTIELGEQNPPHNHSEIRKTIELGKKRHKLTRRIGIRRKRRELLSAAEGTQEKNIKILVGSVGSKSNKIPYVKVLLGYLSKHSNLSKSVLWTPATTRVASLYAAADVYVMNSQGQGETFGRVTIEAMAFGLPVLGTDAGGTKEIVEHNVTGLLHPLGRPGAHVLAQNLQFLLHNPSVRQQMGMEGRKKVEKMYMKRHMYKRFADALFKCMRIK